MSAIPIKRISPTTDQTAPWEGVEFVHEVGSDALIEALRTCFPRYRNLRERKHAAIIQFLTAELAEMLSSNTRHASAVHTNGASGPEVALKDVRGSVHLHNPLSAAPSPASSECSSAPGEDINNPTASSMPVTQPSFIDPAAATHSSQYVFHAVDGRTMQQKSKRKMTAEERLEYKETRKRGACSKCKRLKGKCTHMMDFDNKPSTPNTMADQFKRGISLGTDFDDTKLIKAPRLQRPSDEDSHSSDTSQQFNPHQHQSADMSRRSSNVSMKSPPALSDPQWSATYSERSEATMPGLSVGSWQPMPDRDTDTGYVPLSHSSEEIQSFAENGQQSSGWPGIDQGNLESLYSVNSFHPSISFDHSQDGASYHGFPFILIHGPDQDLHPAADLPAYGGWTLGQQLPSDDIG